MRLFKKGFFALMAAVLVLGFASCKHDDADNDVATGYASEIVGSYSGDLAMTVMGQAFNYTLSYGVEKVDDTHVNLVVPAFGNGGMALPALTVPNIPVTKATVEGKEVIEGTMDSYAGTVTVDGVEKSFTFSSLVMVVDGNSLSVVYSLKYGSMPQAMACSFKGTK